jgi:hypothetical protein
VWGKAHLTCKDSLLVGWGGATDQHLESSCVVCVSDQGVAALEGCTLQYHPDSKHVPVVLTRHGQGCSVEGLPDNPLPSSLVVADQHCHVDLLKCQLVGPAFRDAAPTGFGVRAGAHATVALVGVCWMSMILSMNRPGSRW